MKNVLLSLLVMSLSAIAAPIDTQKSSLDWKGSKGAAGFKLGSHNGKIFIRSGEFNEKDGKLTSGNVIVDMTSFTVEDLEGEWADKFISHMKSADFFKVEEHQTSELKIKSVKGNTMIADLTINGITNEVSVDFKKSGKKYKGALVFDRTKFNMNYGDDKSLGDKFIHHEVEVKFAIYTK